MRSHIPMETLYGLNEVSVQPRGQHLANRKHVIRGKGVNPTGDLEAIPVTSNSEGPVSYFSSLVTGQSYT